MSVLNGFTNFYGGFVIFAVIGFLAQQSGQTVEEVGASGNSVNNIPGIPMTPYQCCKHSKYLPLRV